MNIPGFTAEASLKKISECYYHAAIEGTHAGGAVHAAQGVFSDRPDLLGEAIKSGSPSFGRKLCWLPYWGFCRGHGNITGYVHCLKFQYIC